MYRKRIVDSSLDSRGRQGFYQFLAAWGENRINVEHMTIGGIFQGKLETAIGKRHTVCSCMAPAGFGPVFQVAELYAQHRALDSFHTIVEAFQYVFVLFLRPPVPKHSHLPRQFRIASSD